jgi:hypothetical protein
LAKKAGRVAADHAKCRDVAGDYAAGSDNGVAPDGDTRGNDAVRSYPAVILHRDLGRGAFLEADGRMDILVSMVETREADVLRENDVVADGHRGYQGIAETDAAVIPDDDVAHPVIDAGKILDDRMSAHDEFSEGHHIQPYIGSDDRVSSPPVYEWIDEGPYPPARSGLSGWHQDLQDQFLVPLTRFYFPDDAQFFSFLAIRE